MSYRPPGVDLAGRVALVTGAYSGVGAYRASKQASRMLAWALAEQLADEPVTVNALNPGYVQTALTRTSAGR